jgi:peptide/nickel transport system substrate-binding protein
LTQDSNFYLALNFRATQYGFDDAQVRRAFSQAIDRDRLVTVALHGRGEAAVTPVPTQDPYYAGSTTGHAPSANVEAAGAALDQIGWTRGPDGIRARAGSRLAFTCVVQDDEMFRTVARCVGQDLRRVGVHVDFEFALPFAPFYAACGAGPDAFISKWLWPDPVEALIGFTSTWCDGRPNWQHASVREVDQALHSWLRAQDADQLRSAAEALQESFVTGLPYIPLAFMRDSWLIHPSVAHLYRIQPGMLYPEYGPGRHPDEDGRRNEHE